MTYPGNLSIAQSVYSGLLLGGSVIDLFVTLWCNVGIHHVQLTGSVGLSTSTLISLSLSLPWLPPRHPHPHRLPSKYIILLP